MYPEISIINFVKNFDPKYKITKSSLSKLKNRKLIIKQVSLVLGLTQENSIKFLV